MAQKKVVVILPFRGFDEETYRVLRGTLASRGYQVTTAGLFTGAAEAADGTSVPVDMRIHDIKTYQYDAYVFLGGEGVRTFFDNPAARKLAKDISYKVIGATGEAIPFLAMAGAFKKKKVTAPIDWVDYVRRNGCNFTGKPLEVDEKIITAQDEDGAIAQQFANAIADALA